MAQIRQEINIIDHLASSVAGSVSYPSERIYLDTSQYSGTVTYRFEVVAKNVNATINYRSDLWYGPDTGVETNGPTIPANTTSFTLFSTTFTPTNAPNTYKISLLGTENTADLQIKSARIVIIQNATTLTNTETQIEIGNYNLTRTAEAATALTNPKYWKYVAANWDGTKTFYAEAVYDSGSMDTITVALETSTDILAPSWSTAVTIVSAVETTVATRTRSAAFTPVDGNWYRITSFNGSMDNHDIYRAGVVVRSNSIAAMTASGTALSFFGGNSSNSAYAQSFTPTNNYTLTGVILKLSKVGSPTDTVNIDIVSTLGGSSLANATQSCSSLTTSLEPYTLTFGTPVALSGGTTYYIQLTRSPDNLDGSNAPRIETTATDIQTNGSKQVRNVGVWSAATTEDLFYVLLGSTDAFTKLEPQYLLANTLFAAGTALQTFLTEWDSTEWDDGAGSIAYTFQAEAANGSTSDVTLQEADGGGLVTGSTLTNIDNAQISSALTMPADQNLDVIANANAGDVAAARILVAYVFSAAAPQESSEEPYHRPQYH